MNDLRHAVVVIRITRFIVNDLLPRELACSHWDTVWPFLRLFLLLLLFLLLFGHLVASRQLCCSCSFNFPTTNTAAHSVLLSFCYRLVDLNAGERNTNAWNIAVGTILQYYVPDQPVQPRFHNRHTHAPRLKYQISTPRGDTRLAQLVER